MAWPPRVGRPLPKTLLRGSARFALAERVVGFASHAPAPFGVEVPHAAFVVDRHVLFAAVQYPRRLAAGAHRAALPVHAEQVFMQVAAERAPDHVVIADALGALLRRVALQSEAAKLDQQLVRPERNRGVHAQYRSAQVIGHARENVDQYPAAGREAGPAD